MAAEKSHSSLGIPADLAAVLSSIDSEKHELPVWTFASSQFLTLDMISLYIETADFIPVC